METRTLKKTSSTFSRLLPYVVRILSLVSSCIFFTRIAFVRIFRRIMFTVWYSQRDKCEQYWPSPGQSHVYGGVKVTCQRELVFAEFTRRHLVLNMVRCTLMKILFRGLRNCIRLKYSFVVVLNLHNVIPLGQNENRQHAF